MDAVYWQMIGAVASWVSALAIVAGSIFVVVELRQAAKDRNLHISTDLFNIWHSPEFQDDQFYILHQLPGWNYQEFIAHGRGDRAERAIHRVGAFYDRVGNLIMTKLIRQDELLPTIGGDAIRVWNKIEPLVREARRQENSLLFQNYEAVLPNCLECYVPIVKVDALLTQAQGIQGERIDPAELRKQLASGVIVLDVSKAAAEHKIQGAIRTEPNDLSGWLRVIPRGKDVVTYCT
jgi:hypothetical protein